jgi:hypothetical protein
MQSEVRLRRPAKWQVVALLVLAAFLEIGCDATQIGNSGVHELLYVGNQGPNTVSAYSISSNGSLTAIDGSPFALGGDSLIADPNGEVLFSFGLNTDTIHLYTDTIALDGSLKVSSDLTDNALAGVRATNPAGTVLYVSSINAAEDNRGWKIYSIQPEGTLQLVDGLIDQVAGRLVFTPDGSTAFAAYCYFFLPNIEQFSVASNGMLTNTRNQISTQVPFEACPNAVTLAASGNMLAAPWSDATSLDPGKKFITLFNIDRGSHELNPPAGSMFPASGVGQDAIFDPSGHFLITAQDNGVGVYEVGQDSLTEVRGSPFGGVGMDRVVFTPAGTLLVAISRAARGRQRL